jgi:hypothetical protein
MLHNGCARSGHVLNAKSKLLKTKPNSPFLLSLTVSRRYLGNGNPFRGKLGSNVQTTMPVAGTVGASPASRGYLDSRNPLPQGIGFECSSVADPTRRKRTRKRGLGLEFMNPPPAERNDRRTRLEELVGWQAVVSPLPGAQN